MAVVTSGLPVNRPELEKLKISPLAALNEYIGVNPKSLLILSAFIARNGSEPPLHWFSQRIDILYLKVLFTWLRNWL